MCVTMPEKMPKEDLTRARVCMYITMLQKMLQEKAQFQNFTYSKNK